MRGWYTVTDYRLASDKAGGDKPLAQLVLSFLERYVAGQTPQDYAKAGGEARAAALSPERRSEIARRAGIARWTKPEG